MYFTIKPLTSTLSDTFTNYLSNLDFGHEPHWATCFCRYYHTDCDGDTWKSKSGEVNKQDAVRAIEDGNMKGYLAFDGDICVGWLNANNSNAYIRLTSDISHLTVGKRVGLVICFVIHPNYRRKGIATALLSRAVTDFKEQGYNAVLGIPFDSHEAPEKMYRGKMSMFTNLGFKEIENHENVHVMWLDL